VTGADGTIAFVKGDGGLLIGLYPAEHIARDSRVQIAATGARHSVGVMVSSTEEVDALLATAERAGATVPAPPHLRPFGVYSGYFADPDGHLWEVGYDSGTSG
jgi:predicted lactoylglutathione lyase